MEPGGSGFKASPGHWCHHTVTRTVSCQVQNGSETVVQRVYQSCRWPGPCANLVRVAPDAATKYFIISPFAN
ncbi:collagen alpha-1(XXVI) chain-like protein [Cricetulus griseus]|uniref:Collagen alpha-1(XXVI) chain-like protein n=1 Tax=Cricetulus griseus TaxID=10029 RepID=A0A061I426_CRIGR|nr:collagen alpha-1(XXVI) chain-like protein [Cricetulus griseus]